MRKQIIDEAVLHLNENDPVMRSIIETVGEYTLRPQRDRFGMLVRSVLSQQLSVTAAETIGDRLKVLAGGKITPESIRELSFEELRSVGLSQQKANCVLNLAAKTADGDLPLNTIGRLSDEAVIATLTQLKGIGRWTAEMFLIFSLGRMDVFPFDDLGVRVAIRNNYSLDDLPDKDTAFAIAAKWRPFASVASWYCWRTLDNK